MLLWDIFSNDILVPSERIVFSNLESESDKKLYILEHIFFFHILANAGIPTQFWQDIQNKDFLLNFFFILGRQLDLSVLEKSTRLRFEQKIHWFSTNISKKPKS